MRLRTRKQNITPDSAHVDSLGTSEDEERRRKREQEDDVTTITKSDLEHEAVDLRKAEWSEDDIAWALGNEFSKAGSGKRNTKERSEMAAGKKGFAMSGGRYPIGNEDELKKAVRAVGRGKGSHDAIRAHIASAAKKLGLTKLIPDHWTVAGATKAEWDTEFFVKSEEEHLIYGVVLEPDLEDSQGDKVTPEDIAKAAHEWLAQSRKQDVQHAEDDVAIFPVESFVAPVDMEVPDPTGETHFISKDSWVMVSKVEDADAWESVKKGELTGYSISGSGVRIPLAA